MWHFLCRAPGFVKDISVNDIIYLYEVFKLKGWESQYLPILNQTYKKRQDVCLKILFTWSFYSTLSSVNVIKERKGYGIIRFHKVAMSIP